MKSGHVRRQIAVQKIYFASLGCAKNLVDSEVMLGRLQRAGFEITLEPMEADVLVINTCAFIQSAKQESIDTILELARYKDIGNCKRLVVCGCLSHRYREDLMGEIPEIDVFLGLDELDKIETACAGNFRHALRNPPMSRRLYGAADARVSTTSNFSRYLKISEGCDHKCSFCVIPTFRGLHRSRPPEDIHAEAEQLVREGAVELNLVAQDLGHYGRDLQNGSDLASLLLSLVNIEKLRWIRLHYIYPAGLKPELLALVAEEPKIVPYLDIPFQHSSKKVLRDMQRPGYRITSLDRIAELRKAIPGLALRTSLIVGFPSEEEEDVEGLIDFIEAARFDHLGVFTYSHEEGSLAAEVFDDRWPREVKQERRDRIMACQQLISLENNKLLVGKRRDCLIEGQHPKSEHLLSGRLATQAPEADGRVIINEGAATAGEIVSVEITEAHPYDLVARVINEAD